MDLPVKKVVRKYTRRCLIEKEITEQTDFFISTGSLH